MKSLEYLLDEYADHLLYRDLAKHEKKTCNKEALLKLAQQEYDHYLFWKKFVPVDTTDGKDTEPAVSPFFLCGFRFMRKVLGLTFTIKFLERHEHVVIQEYKKVAADLSGEDKARLEAIIEDEKEHENFFIGQIKDIIRIFAGIGIIFIYGVPHHVKVFH